MSEIIKQCLFCGGDYVSDTFYTNHKYCSVECRNKAHGIGTKTYDRNCKHCGKPFNTNNYNKTFCSQECRIVHEQENKPKSKIKYETRQCKYCGSDFEWNSSNPKKQCCSSKCYAMFYAQTHKTKTQHKIISRVCEYCKTEFECYDYSTQKYCSSECRTKSNREKDKTSRQDTYMFILKNKITEKVRHLINMLHECKATFNNQCIDYRELGDIPNNIRNLVYERDNYKCQICGRKNNLHIHHVIKRANGGDHSLDNLITLCSSCHRHIEIGYLDNAISSCLKNALNSECNKYDKYDLIQDLQDLFDIIKRENNTELLIKLSGIIDKLENEMEYK